VSKRIGPSMSTEPGWMAVLDALPYYFGSTIGTAANDPSMLLSFERPASAGIAWIRRIWRDQQTRLRPALYASPRSLKTAQKPQSAAIDKRRLKNGYHRALHDLGAPQGAIRSRWARSPSR
jgi:hypothetical protein